MLLIHVILLPVHLFLVFPHLLSMLVLEKHKTKRRRTIKQQLNLNSKVFENIYLVAPHGIAKLMHIFNIQMSHPKLMPSLEHFITILGRSNKHIAIPCCPLVVQNHKYTPLKNGTKLGCQNPPYLLLKTFQHGSDVGLPVLFVNLHSLLQLYFGHLDEVVVFLYGFQDHLSFMISLLSQVLQKFSFLTLWR